MSFRESFYTILCGIFGTSLTLGTVVGVTKLVDPGLQVRAGLLAHPFTLLGTDLARELYGRAGVNMLTHHEDRDALAAA